jgi:Protein of unknown function (DUF3667)
MTNCKHCNSTIDGKFCSECGQAVILKRIDGHYVKHEIEHLIHFEKGIFYTIKELLIRPGQSVKSFIHDDRNRLVKPIIFVIVASLIYTVTLNFFKIKDGFISYSNNEWTPITNAIFGWINGHLGYSNIIIGVFIALWIKLFFKKYNYNLFEILILMCFVLGMGMLIGSVFAVIKGVIKIDVGKYGGFIYIIYCSWAIAQFFDKGKIMSYVKSIITFILGFLSFNIFMYVVGLSLDWLMKVQ